ncbi:ferritin-like domain-containing protein [Anaerolentibacter hominis]|uniref:ferritin-like domain-containing protein n=1 Tax=Anaerolentibacter hominis TaxID=3079009 RepID=UPI0031B8926B
MGNDKMIFTAAGEYPPVRAEEKNKEYGRLMLDNMGGRNSEMSAVSLYFYNHLITKDYSKTGDHFYSDDKQGLKNNMPAVFYSISVVEMHHLDIFGTLAKQLGEEPRLWSAREGKVYYWSPGYIQYMNTLPELLYYAIREEEAAVEKYRRQTQIIKDSNIVENLNRIIKDEEVHLHIFHHLLDQYCGDNCRLR